jgi:tRNA pseudouridine55 synthase
VDGLVLVDKPAGKTSHDLTLAVRRALGVRRAGHAGTLDPFATGLLLVLVGRGRRVQRFFTALPKGYEVVARLGAVSTTGDPEGEITPTGVPVPARLELPTGRLRQRPPAYSAVRVGGRRAYERFEEIARDGDRVELLVECSAGTYVRSLVAELGGYCEALRRTRVGPFDVADADPTRVIGLGEALSFLPTVVVDADAAWRAAHGQAVPGEAPGGGEGEVVLVDADGPVAIAVPRDGALKPVVGFRG